MARLQELPTITVDELANRTAHVIENLRAVTIITRNGQEVASLVPQPVVHSLVDLLPVMDALQTEIEIVKEAVRRQAESLNLEVEEFHYPTR